jgi:hypothetical protein
MDQALYWNDVALEANRISFTEDEKREQGGPTLSSRALSIVHLAMHDAYVGISGTLAFGPYMGPLPAAPPGASFRAAIAGAAYTALVALYPKQKAFFDKKLNSITHILSGEEAGHRYGRDIAFALLQKRKDDPDNSDKGFIPKTGRSYHKPDPDNSQGFLAPFYGAKSSPFAVTKRYILTPPPIDNPEYIRVLKDVKAKGIAPDQMGTLPATAVKRTVDETLIGIFWGYDGANELGTPPRLYNQIVRSIAIAKSNTEEQNVRLFALVNAAMADAGILAWTEKYTHNFWRPVVGIREHDKSMGSTGIASNNIDDNCDPLWLPLGAPKSNATGKKNFTPDFPAYPSGHATFGAAAFHITRLFYGVAVGDRKKDPVTDGCDFVSDEFNGVTKDNNGTIRPCHIRNFPDGLWQAIIENGLSRVYLGVHWSFDAFKTNNANKLVFSTVAGTNAGVGGVDLGLAIAEDIFESRLIASTAGPAV